MIILLSIFIFPVSYLGVNFLYYSLITHVGNFTSEEFYNPDEIEEEWEIIVNSIEGRTTNDVSSYLKNIDEYPEAHVRWISDEGEVLTYIGQNEALNEKWNVSETIDYMRANNQKKQYFTTLSYLEGSENSGYAMLQIPQSYMGTEWEVLRERYSFVWFFALGLIWFLFVFISWVFFNKLRKRLVKIQMNMEINENQLIPSKMSVQINDEIGQLEDSFNKMVDQLNESHKKEKSEEAIRKNLISSLSHDLRTPLSIINGHTHKLIQLQLTEEAKKSVIVINQKVDFMAELIDNLTSYTVLSEGKLPLNKQTTDVVAVVRSSFIAWYSIFEELEFEIDVQLNEPIHWDIDEIWLRRILDNLFQNVQRHARDGKYILIETCKENGLTVLKIHDHGSGMIKNSKRTGAKIGLSIVEMMLKQMNLKKTVTNDLKGTTITIFPMED
ncbi:ATP-binding protein [Salipaludibacillus sp. HK11]|uniref:HAMP domain-containing sensor histidine kinase n=1 Tax=Salipaludibacillus sp. HK11 TaxID=3394320 RepID=UPI0039FBAD58